MQVQQIPFSKTGYFNKIMLNYISENDSVRDFYNRELTSQNFADQIIEKQNFGVNRDVLVKSLHRQYKNLQTFSFRENVEENIEKLKSKNTFTVTTGHQLCLFTGPLYFIYKIANAINMAKALRDEYPQNHFIPVFWMATEDHDFLEINHIHFKGHKVVWHRKMGGAVGRMEVESVAKALDELDFRFPKGERSTYLLQLFNKAYSHENLTDATRYIVNELFGKYGVVIIDGDDRELKKLAAPYYKRELLEGVAENAVNQTSEDLKAVGFKSQVNARDINLFYLLDDYRERIKRTTTGFATADDTYEFSENEILELLEKHPERFSPNVILRPLYQEVILPNLAYIGGGGELAYWLQLKQMFTDFQVPFPFLRLRNSVAVVDKRIFRKIEKLKLSVEEIFQSYEVLSTALIRRDCEIDEQIEALRKDWNGSLDKWEKLTQTFDPSLKTMVEAERTRILKGMLRLEKKLLRSAKVKKGDKLRMLQEIKNDLFPGGGLQERHDNFSEMYLNYGKDFIPMVLENTCPFENEFTVLME